MTFRRAVLTASSAVVALVTVAGCTAGSDGDGTPSATVTATDTVTSAAPPTGSGVPASPSGTGAGSSGSSSGPGLCTPTVMTLAVGSPNGAAGTTYFSVTATNGSSTPCVTTGFPGVAFLDGSGTQFLQADRDPTLQSTTLTVAPGGQVTATIAVGDIGNGNATCTPSNAILFTLPDNTDSTKLTVSNLQVCDARVQAFVSGDGS